MEKQNKNAKKQRYSLGWKVLTLVAVLLIVYTAYHVFFGLAESIKTTPAGVVEQSTSIMLEGVIFRDEKTVKTNLSGDMRPYLYDGERASVDSIVACVYSKSGHADANAKIEELEEKLDVLKQSNVRGLVSIVDIEKMNDRIDQIYTTIMIARSNGDNFTAHRAEKELLINLNKLKIYKGEVDSYNDEIKAIEEELDKLYSSFEGEQEYISADEGGYFYHSCDGYENTLTADFLSGLTVSNLRDTTEQVKKKPTQSSDYRCKFVYDNVWKIATLCDNATVALLSEGESYSVTLYDVREHNLTMTLEKIGDSDGAQTVLILSCTTMPENFDYTRYQSLRLDISSTEGYRVPKEALLTVTDDKTGEKKQGVYVLNAGVVEFRRIDIIADCDGYYIVSKLDKSKDNYREYLNVNDLIILDTAGLYEGKMLLR